MKRIIIDADPGVDDAFAILLAAYSDELKIESITTVEGNCSVENGTNNAFKILDLAGKSSIPVYQGMDKAIKTKNKDASHVHGNNGMGGITYETINRQVEDMHAVDYLIKTVKENPDQITLVAIGPLTNIACAIKKDKDFAKNVQSLILMGGSANKGNITPYAEFNFYKDPDAAKIVFDANFKQIIMMGLDVTTKLPLDQKLENLLQNMNNELADFLFKITRTGAKFDRQMGLDGFILNDPLTVAYLIDPSIVELKAAKIDIETTGEKMGKSNVVFEKKTNCLVGYKVDANKFYNLLFHKIFHLELNSKQ